MYRRVHQLAWKIRPWIDPSINVNELTASIFVDFFDKAAFAMQMADDNLRYLAPPVPRALPPRTWPHRPTLSTRARRWMRCTSSRVCCHADSRRSKARHGAGCMAQPSLRQRVICPQWRFPAIQFPPPWPISTYWARPSRPAPTIR